MFDGKIPTPETHSFQEIKRRNESRKSVLRSAEEMAESILVAVKQLLVPERLIISIINQASSR